MKYLITSALLLLALLLPAAATAHDIEVDGIYYNINGNNATVTYKGDNPNLYDEYSGTVTIPNSVTYNGRTYSVTTIGDYAFSGCSGLMSVTIPYSVTTIGYDAFSGCSGLMSVTIPNSVTTIGDYAFSGCSSLMSVIIPNSVTAIGGYAFYRCSSLMSVTIPNSVTTIGDYAFSDCRGLTNVTIPNSVTTIGNAAFYRCSSLMSVTIPNSVTTIGDYAFSDCSGLTKLAVENGNNKYDSRDNCNAIIETATNKLIAGCQNTVIPYSVTAIGYYAFHGCSSLTSVTIPYSVTAIGYAAFYDCSGLTSVTIPNSVTTIGDYAFYDCSGLTSVTIPNSVTYIGYAAFSGCSGLTSVTIPNSVTTIGDYAFYGCSGLTSVYCHITDLSRVSVGEKPFRNNIYSNDDYSGRTLHVPRGTAAAYRADENWYPYFGQIVEMDSITLLRGDVNLDGEVNISDINVVTSIIMGAAHDAGILERADVNEDGNINISDVNEIINIILSPVHEWVDLGLPSGTLWATCNVGANSPEDFGDHFAWGETEPKGLYDWSTYKWCLKYEDVWVKELKKYNENSYLGDIDNKIELDLEDDAAYVNWGPKWRMPTLEQFQELCNCCTWQWTTLNDVNGQLVTGPNGKTIFLPAAGGFSSHIYGQGNFGYYWSRTLCTPNKWDIQNEGEGSSHAYIQFFGRSRWHVWYDVRCDGQSVRAVRVPSN